MRQTKSGRTSRHPKRYGFLAASPIASFIDDLEQRILNPNAFVTHQLSRAHSLNCDLPFTEDDLKFPFALPAATTNAKSDTPTYKQAMSGEYKHEFKTAMQTELSELEKLNTFQPVLRSSLPPDTSVLKSTWVFKIKRLPSRIIRKFKARLCVRGDLQRHGIDYWDTYAPVVSWTTVRLVLILCQVHGLKSRQFDYVNAFCQAPLDEDLYMEIPPGYHTINKKISRRYVLKLLMSLYGLRQAGKNWFLYLKASLLRRGFVQSQIDPCLFYSATVVIIIYVDDAIICGLNQHDINLLIESIKSEFNLTDEGDFHTFLGIDMRINLNGMFELIQPHLIDKALYILGLRPDSNPCHTPADRLLHRDASGKERESQWSYRTVLGIFNYIAMTTRPDISFAVSQCARFAENPKQSHEQALKRIGRYLLKTKERGLIINPNEECLLKCFVDADFAGLWKVEDPEDKKSATSRTGFVLTYAGIPITWCSKLQSLIALSTTEAEYMALSQSMRELLPTQELLRDLSKAFQLDPHSDPKFASTVFEDNNSALELAKCPRMRPRTKHIAVKYHFFREHIQNGNINIEPIDTNIQVADILTKPLPRPAFESLRHLMMGW